MIIFAFFIFFAFWPFPWQRQPFWKNQPLKAQLHMAFDIPTRFHKVWSRHLREMCRRNFWQKKERIIIIRYDYNLTIMKSPKPATDTIYPYIKCWWYRTMLNFYPPFLCHVLAAILKMADILKLLKTQNCSSNGDLSLCQNLCLYHYSVRSYQH
jgi:hypothetical protein